MSRGLSPNDIRHYEFSNQMRGYDKDEVKEFLEQAAVTLETVRQENLKLTMQVQSLQTQLEAVKQFESAIKDAAIDARRNADATIANAKKQATEILSQAQAEADEQIGSREQRIHQVEEQLTKLEMTRTSYLTKLRDLIDSHRDLVSDIEQMKVPPIPPPLETVNPAPPVTPPESSQPAYQPQPPVQPAASQTQPEPFPQPPVQPVASQVQPATPPQPPSQPMSPKFQPDTQAETSFAMLNPFEPIDPLATSGSIEVEESSEVSRHKLETIATTGEPDEPERTEEANAPSRIVAVEADQAPAPPKSPLDPELAAALENYQQAHQETPELNQRPVQPAEAATRPPEIPPEFIPAGGGTPKAAAPQPEEPTTDKIKTGNGEDEATEHNAIDIDQPVGDGKKKKEDGEPAPEEIAHELDAVAAKFEEEMDKAARS